MYLILLLPHRRPLTKLATYTSLVKNFSHILLSYKTFHIRVPHTKVSLACTSCKTYHIHVPHTNFICTCFIQNVLHTHQFTKYISLISCKHHITTPHNKCTTYMSVIQNVPHTCSSYKTEHIRSSYKPQHTFRMQNLRQT